MKKVAVVMGSDSDLPIAEKADFHTTCIRCALRGAYFFRAQNARGGKKLYENRT